MCCDDQRSVTASTESWCYGMVRLKKYKLLDVCGAVCTTICMGVTVVLVVTGYFLAYVLLRLARSMSV